MCMLDLHLRYVKGKAIALYCGKLNCRISARERHRRESRRPPNAFRRLIGQNRDLHTSRVPYRTTDALSRTDLIALQTLIAIQTACVFIRGQARSVATRAFAARFIASKCSRQMHSRESPSSTTRDATIHP